MAPKRILYCIDSIGRGGTETQLIGLIQHLDRRLFAPHLLTMRSSDPLVEESACSRFQLDVGRLRSPATLLRLRDLVRYLRENGIDIVETYFQDPTLLGITAARLARVPVRLITFRDLGFWRRPGSEFLMRRVYPLATGFLANSQSVANTASVRDCLDPALFTVIYNGIDQGRFPFTEHSEGRLSIGALGNLNRHVKRADLFLRAAARVAATHPEVTWHLIGDGALRHQYEILAAQLGIADRTVFAGRIADTGAYLRRLAVGVTCSDSEGFSNAILEYMLSGCTVVATAVGGNREAIQHDLTGLLVPPDDEEALAEALLRLIDDNATRLRLSRAARDFAEKHFSWSTCVDAHQNLYHACLRAVRSV